MPSAKRHDWRPFRADERPVEHASPHGRYRLALAYANSYFIGMSSLAVHRVFHLVHQRPEWSCERFFLDGEGMPLSVESDTPMNQFGAIAFSISFEEDYVNFLSMLDRARIPLRRADRQADDPLILVGGSCATINPLPLSEFVDAFPLGAAENLLSPLLEALDEETSRDGVLERLAASDGFYVPSRQRPEEGELPKLKKLELSEEQMRSPGQLPTTAIVSPRTEFSNKFLIEMSRGCPEKCLYCWATFGMGTFRWHATESILGTLDRARGVTDQLGFIATAVGDHPEIERILTEANEMGFRSAVSSIRIPAVTEGVLTALRASGDRSITLAPETGSDELRVKLNKPIPNSLLLDKVRAIFRHGFTQLKLYFILGLPGEEMSDVEAILELGAECREIMLQELAPTGVIGNVHLGTNVLVPKPYTGWQREAMDDPRELKRKIAVLKRGVASMPNVTMSTPSVRQAIWQTYISRAGSDAADLIERVHAGETVASILRTESERVRPEVFERFDGPLRWHFMRAGRVEVEPALEVAPHFES